MSAEKPRADWTVLVLPVVGLATAIFQAFAAWRGSKPAPAPEKPLRPLTPLPVPPWRADAAITAEQHEAIRREAAARRAPPASKPPPSSPLPGAALHGEEPPDADPTDPDALTIPPPVIEPRDLQ